jgi:PAS domain S-box-containing protein
MSTYAQGDSSSVASLLNSTHDGIFLIDRRRTYVFFNSGCERITGYSASEILGAQCTYGDVVTWRDKHGRALTGILCPTRALFDGARDASRQRMELTRRDGIRNWVDTYYMALLDEQGKVDYVLGVVRELGPDGRSRPTPSLDESAFDTVGIDSAAGIAQPDSAGLTSPAGQNGSKPLNGNLLLDNYLEDVERQVILRALAAAGWQRNKAAELMGISRSRLYRRMEALGIDPNVKT